MAISRIDIVSAGTTGNSATGIAVPFSAPNAGDLLIGSVSGAAAMSTPSGWTPLDHNDQTNGTLYVYYRVSDGTETTVTFGSSGPTVGHYVGSVATYRGALSPPAGNGNTGASTSGTTLAGPNLTSVPAGAFSLSIGGSYRIGNGAFSATVAGTNWGEILDATSAISGATKVRGIDVAENTVSTGSVTGPTLTWSVSNDARCAVSFYIQVAPPKATALMMSL